MRLDFTSLLFIFTFLVFVFSLVKWLKSFGKRKRTENLTSFPSESNNVHDSGNLSEDQTIDATDSERFEQLAQLVKEGRLSQKEFVALVREDKQPATDSLYVPRNESKSFFPKVVGVMLVMALIGGGFFGYQAWTKHGDQLASDNGVNYSSREYERGYSLGSTLYDKLPFSYTAYEACSEAKTEDKMRSRFYGAPFLVYKSAHQLLTTKDGWQGCLDGFDGTYDSEI